MAYSTKYLPFLIALISSSLASCEQGYYGDRASYMYFTEPVSRTAPLPRIASSYQSIKAQEEIDRIIDEWEQKCSVPDCPTKLVHFSPAVPVNESLGQRILILENFFVPDSAMLRYRNRVLGFYKLEEDAPKYKEYFPDTEVYEPFDEIAEFLSQLPYHVPAADLSSERLRENGFSKLVKHQPFLSHGVPIFEWLADLVPEAQFVIADLPTSPFSLELFCHFDEKETMRKMRTKVSRAMIQVLQLIETHDINYVNISEAPSPEALERNYGMFCRGPKNKSYFAIDDEAKNNFLNMQAFVFRKLSEIPTITVFQSLPNTDQTIYLPDNKRHDLVAADYDNFVRVGYFASAEAKFGVKGAFDARLLSRPQLNQFFCASTYVNSGVTEGSPASIDEPEPQKISEHALYYRYLGFDSDRVIRVMATSWATPLALAHAIYLKNTGGPKNARELRKYLRTNSNQPKLIDPLRFKQFELYANDQ